MELTLRDEIENLFFSYAVGFDEQRLDDLAPCFTEDAEFFSEGWCAAEMRSARRWPSGGSSGLVTASSRATSTPTSGSSRSSEGRFTHSLWNLVVTTRDGSYIDRGGTYEDELVQRDGRWLSLAGDRPRRVH